VEKWGSYNIFLLTLKYMIGTMSIGFLKNGDETNGKEGKM
jgi:hypothetical protein